MYTTVKKERKLSSEERINRLDINTSVSYPNGSKKVIRMNSTYLEIDDGMYRKRGLMSFFGFFAVGGIGVVIIFILYNAFYQYLDPNWDHHDEFELLWTTLFSITISFLFLFGCIAFLREIGECFRYTHYPIRFNRKNRMVYVFRGDNTILSIPWDEVYFTILYKRGKYSSYNIYGLVMRDLETVKEVFNFVVFETSKYECLQYWEFTRLYMEKGIPSVMKASDLKYYLPIADKYETIFQSWKALTLDYEEMPIFRAIITPLLILAFIGRFIHRWTSKIPIWPKEIENECKIEQNDPYIFDSRKNPEGYR